MQRIAAHAVPSFQLVPRKALCLAAAAASQRITYAWQLVLVHTFAWPEHADAEGAKGLIHNCACARQASTTRTR